MENIPEENLRKEIKRMEIKYDILKKEFDCFVDGVKELQEFRAFIHDGYPQI